MPTAPLDFYADDAVIVNLVSGEVKGRGATAKWWETFVALFPDWSATVPKIGIRALESRWSPSLATRNAPASESARAD